jgi:hypothetical protein
MKFLTSILMISLLVLPMQASMAEETDSEPGPAIGIVAETMDSGGYTYMRLAEQDIWIATATMPVAVGDQVQYSGGMEMRDFNSRTLDRTFESILFIQNVSLVGNDLNAIHAAAIAENGSEKMQIPKPVTVAAPVAGEITRLTKGKTVAEIIAESTQLKDQTISLNARVIKVSKNIVGKNWITLQDGTGTAPDNKLLATSQELVSLGDTVIARGIVRTDIDIGSGYKYKVLMEEVTFSPGFE